jgi:peptidoglycan/xylan/chitin deacetylase (PgdA/CDA1 family)
MKRNVLNVALTFDDGYLDHYNIARVLAHLNIKATFFIITHLNRHPDDGRPLLASQPSKIKDIYKMGHEIGSHSCTHPDLPRLSSHKLESELKDSKEFLEDLGVEVFGFAYPKGVHDQRTIEMTKRYYVYGRGTYGFCKDMWNVACNDRYDICAVGIRHLPKLPIKLLQRFTLVKPVIMLHREDLSTILLLIRGLKILYPKIRFVTMKETAELIKEVDEMNDAIY